MTRKKRRGGKGDERRTGEEGKGDKLRGGVIGEIRIRQDSFLRVCGFVFGGECRMNYNNVREEAIMNVLIINRTVGLVDISTRTKQHQFVLLVSLHSNDTDIVLYTYIRQVY